MKQKRKKLQISIKKNNNKLYTFLVNLIFENIFLRFSNKKFKKIYQPKLCLSAKNHFFLKNKIYYILLNIFYYKKVPNSKF